jgi:ERCC4-related helicase
MIEATTAPPEQGQLVTVRQRQYVVTEVAKSTLPEKILQPTPSPAQHLVTLSSVEDDALGEELQVVWEIEPGAKTIEKVALPEPNGFDEPPRLDAFLDAVRWGASSSADVRSVQSPFRSGIDIETYQLDPVVRAVQMPRVNLLIADDVGLGKTIEAGMVILELIIRHRARRVLIVCPAGLQIQWQDQMRDKFGLDFRIIDTELMKQLRRERGIHVNPWGHFPRLITSIDFLKRERPLRLFRETLPSEGESIYPRKYDILVLDEAHNCAPSGRGKYATDSLRTQALRTLTPHFEHKLFLTATPHNGYVESFSALLELLDDQRFARGTLPDHKQLDAVMVRRMKSELKDFDGTPLFPKRELEPLEVPYTQEEKAIHSALKAYTKLRQANFRDHAEKFATEFVLKTLKKRLFSSPAAFKSTLEQHERSIHTATKSKSAPKPTISVLQRQVDLVEEEYTDDVELEEATDDAVDAATQLFREPSNEEGTLLKQMKEWATKASSRLDTKAQVLIDWLKAHIRPGGKWTEERVIIFTEYRATQNWLQEQLAIEGFTADERLLTLNGGMDSDKREAVKAAFQFDPKVAPVRILLATDAASEGIDLQNHCSKLIHFEIPWNPNRMEQRNGRIDRHGQKAKEILIYHFVGKGYKEREKSDQTLPAGELEGDLEFLMRAARKVNQIREDLGKVGPVIAEQVEQAMLGHRSRLDTTQAERDAEPVRTMLKFERDLRAQIQRLRDQLDQTQRQLRLTPENVQKVVEVALQLSDQPALIPTKVEGIWPDAKRNNCPVFHLPAFTQPSWRQCAEGLRQPHTNKLRPIVFDHHLSKGRDDVVLAHLNHRLVQMSLRLLRAEVWSTEGKGKLNRITARIVPDTVLHDPAIIGHARLVVVGGDCQRLHEEIITAGGRLEGGKFVPLNVGQTKDALDAAKSDEPSETMKARLLDLYHDRAEPLAKALEARMKERTKGLAKILAERETKEIDDITTILKELKSTIEEKLNDSALNQMTFEGWADVEREQLERNMNSLRARVREIPAEIEHETAAIKARFVNPQPRMFPVAVTYLVPERMAK